MLAGGWNLCKAGQNALLEKKMIRISRRKTFYSLIFIFCIIIIFFLNVLVVYIINKELQTYSAGSFAVAQTFSVFCGYLSTHPDDDYENFERKKKFRISVEKGGNYVCGTRNVTDIVRMVVERQSRVRLAAGRAPRQYLSCGNFSLARKSGQLTAFFSQILSYLNSTETSFEGKVRWNQHSRYSYLDPVISYKHGEITIPEGRVYNVYASIIFNTNNSDASSCRRPPIMSLRICRKTYGYEQTLFSKTELYRNTNKSSVSTLHIAGQVVLQKGDIVLVRVSNLKRLLHDSTGNTFGVFPLR